MQTIKCKNNFGEMVDVPKEKFFFRPSVYGLIIQQGKILTLTNKSNGKIWFPGGGIEVGEKIEDALYREIKEEAGIEVEIKKFVFIKENFFYYQPLDEAYHAFLFFYLCSPLSTKLISDKNVDDLESKNPQWKNMTEIKKDEISDLKDDLFRIINELSKFQYRHE
jgi:ADP-ribose pyrophosphatase YjhB (NUDIX family)